VTEGLGSRIRSVDVIDLYRKVWHRSAEPTFRSYAYLNVSRLT
jgi:hypothetical protein